MSKTLKILLIVMGAGLVLALVGKKMEWFGKSPEIKVLVEKSGFYTIVETVSANEIGRAHV